MYVFKHWLSNQLNGVIDPYKIIVYSHLLCEQ